MASVMSTLVASVKVQAVRERYGVSLIDAVTLEFHADGRRSLAVITITEQLTQYQKPHYRAGVTYLLEDGTKIGGERIATHNHEDEIRFHANRRFAELIAIGYKRIA